MQNSKPFIRNQQQKVRTIENKISNQKFTMLQYFKITMDNTTNPITLN